MKDISYAFAVRGLVYAKICDCPGIIFAVRMVGDIKTIPDGNWIVTKNKRLYRRIQEFG